jgi:diguanylate cyclase (GGDEF)-like protein
MLQETPALHTPLVLIASGDEWLARSLESMLTPNGIAVVKAMTGKQALEYTKSTRPDAIFMESRLPDMAGIDLCRTLRDDPILAAHTPILITTVAPANRRDRLEALRAGAWDYCDLLPDTEEILLRLGTYMRAKIAADQLRQASLQDDLTGLYNLRGLMRRLHEIGSEALRHGRAMACIAFSAGLPPEAAGRASGVATTERLAHLVAQACRGSDAIARLPSNEFVVLAPDTGPAGAHRLAERVLTAAKSHEASFGGAATLDLTVRIGYYAVDDLTAAGIRPVEMLARATAALDRSRDQHPGSGIVGFGPESIPTS